MRLYYTDHHDFPLPPGHKFPKRKYRLLRETLARDARFDLAPAPPADPAVIALAHSRDYVEAFLSGTLPSGMMRRIGFPWSAGLLARTLASVGSTLSAARDSLERGAGGGLAGGTHHAFHDGGSGYCVFNDIAIAVHWLRSAALVHRVAVVDLDVHQGDGTAKIFENDPEVLTFSMHAASNFPFRKQASRIDVELPDGTGDAEYLDILERTLPRVWEFAPEIVFYQAGVDALATDTIGRLLLTPDGLRRRDQLVLRAAKQSGVPCVITLGGGYSEPIEITVEAHAATFRCAADLFARG
ncbi:MAG: histone deacetylase [Acidobacteria bacterium]|nr:histone deacetylase [Acidobacteriota bacterium]MBI3281017.1 histone deacetylase [Acidobacteriota bacterium]